MNTEDLMYASPEDQEFYLKCTRGLPGVEGFSKDGLDSEGKPMCFGLGPHSVRCLRAILEKVHPKTIYEIGTNANYSAALWLELTGRGSSILTTDISFRKETVDSATLMKERYGDRYHYMNRTNPELKEKHLHPGLFDLAFVDGDHSKEGITNDLKECLALRIPYIAFDDFLPQFGQTQEVVSEWGNYVKQIFVCGNIALYKNMTA